MPAVFPAGGYESQEFKYYCHCGIDSYSCTCAPGFANGLCDYDFIAEYDAHCTMESGGRCDMDVDECISNPCTNGAACLDSTSNLTGRVVPAGNSRAFNATPLANAYRCLCTDGYANGYCEYDFVPAYEAQCSLQTGGDCGVDVDECSSSPCSNGGSCTDSTADPTVPAGVYSCACAAGFANGICAYSVIAEYAAQCDVALGGRCDVDVDECVSAPCSNGATCLESGAEAAVPAHAFRCDCASGYTNGNCVYDYIAEYTARCSVLAGGRCDVDVNECDSNPCGAHADACLESVDLTERSLLFSEYMEGSSR